MPIAENLKHWMEIRGVTTAELSEKANVPEPTITKIRTRVTKNPNMDTLQRLAKGLDCSINDLTDAPSVDEEELRALLPSKLSADVNELLPLVLTTLRNQRLSSDRTLAELRKDRNFWRKFALICVGCMIPMLIALLVLVCVLYWDLSHPTQGNIIFSVMQDAATAAAGQ